MNLLKKINQSKLLDRDLSTQGNHDKTLLWVLLCLLAFGLIMVYSASVAQAGLSNFDNRNVFFIKQVQFAGFGLFLAAILMRVPMWRWQRWTFFLLPLTLVVLLIVGIAGEEVNGARRWLPLPGGIKFQPSEAFKLVTIMYMASFFKRRLDVLRDFKRVKWIALPLGLGVGFILMTRDLGSAAVVFAIALALLFLANLPGKWFVFVVGVAAAIVSMVVVTSEFRMRRIAVMWQPWKDPTGTGYQSMGSLMSIERGGWFGEGLGNGLFKRGFLPEAHTDFIAAVITEELGLITLTALILCYCWIVFRAFSIGKQARDLELHYSSFIAIGIGVWIGVQSFINIGVNISLLPNKGLTLPLISYGGSSLIIMIIALTMLLRVDYENRRKIRGFDVADPRDPKEPDPDAADNETQPENPTEPKSAQPKPITRTRKS
ncbi:putative lipid II flippase FtsW [Alysiella filiformis]|uniref:Probable peptidoglycan glycosyltransferase FtsW n=1 Tax=Alysiella filiformis DSM 16848 TaxID=1120981 RepID=A0A286E3T9_9NEIS|nr:putative lipid II flippase FtsW [Alysiella filiformis]QMT31052.1 putative lipid II flippase FtsW [Alysiella filiformis]UBQ55957.1 putative lipid II flippase FtsW [Alysiella filiformis DSM 16848]SOD65570.1 cell division protein FtsW [Alysiella filiformis DSM 16848]